jgi:hypothetical protein
MTEPIPPIVTGARRAPLPVGPLTGPRTRLRRFASHSTAALNRLFDLLPVGRWLHRRAQRSIRLTPLSLPLRRGGAALDGLRVAFLSDLHAGSFMDEDDLCGICERVALAEPDLVLFGGDLINTRERELLLYRRPLGLLRPRLGMFAVPGNHDYFWGPDIGLWTSFLEDQGVEVLLNRGRRVQHGGASLWLGGVDDLTEGAPDLQAALAGRVGDEPAILLSHHPDFFFEAAAADVDLQLSGHTHGGQIRVAGKAAIHHSRFGYERGWFEAEGCRLYVSRGVGVTLLPIRIDAPPEIPVLTLVAADAAGVARASRTVAGAAVATAVGSAR